MSSHSSGVPTLLQCHALTMPFPSPACECTETAQPQSPNTQTIFILRDTALLMKYALMLTGEMWLKKMKKNNNNNSGRKLPTLPYRDKFTGHASPRLSQRSRSTDLHGFRGLYRLDNITHYPLVPEYMRGKELSSSNSEGLSHIVLTPTPLPLSSATVVSKSFDHLKYPLLPTGIGGRYSQTISSQSKAPL